MHVLLIAFAITGWDEKVLIEDFLESVYVFSVLQANTASYFTFDYIILIVFFMFKVEVFLSFCILEFAITKQKFPDFESHSPEFYDISSF